MVEDQDAVNEELEKSVDQLIHETDFKKFTDVLGQLSLRFSTAPNFKAFLESEAFGKDLQKRIKDANGVRNTALCLDYVILTSMKAAKPILSYRGFGLSLLPGKLNEEPDIESIGLCLELLSQCDPTLVKLVEQSTGLGSGVFAAWKLRPRLITNYSDIDAKTIEVWLPFPDSETGFQGLKNFEARERDLGIHR